MTFSRILAMVIGVSLILMLGYCSYSNHGPHLRLDPLNIILMDAPKHIEIGWRSIDVDLVPEIFSLSQDQGSTQERLESAGYELWHDYSEGAAPPPDPHPNDAMPQIALDKLFYNSKEEYNSRGITQIYKRVGRHTFFCGELLVVEIGVEKLQLSRATGYRLMDCL